MTLSSTSSLQRTYPVYPLSHREKLESEQPNLHFKTLHVVRHAEGYHNVNKEYRHIKNLDARLTEVGKQQCRALAQSTNYHALIHNTQLVVTSPLTRCVETAMLSFPLLLQNKTPFVAHEMIRETVNYACDRRRRISELREEFPEIDYSHVESDHDGIWEHYHAKLGYIHDTHRESAQLYQVAERGRRFMEWLGQRKEQEIVVCTHSAFLRCFKSWGHKGGVPMMPEQHLDDRTSIVDHPILEYDGQDEEFEEYMRATYDNCEMRSFLVAFE